MRVHRRTIVIAGIVVITVLAITGAIVVNVMLLESGAGTHIGRLSPVDPALVTRRSVTPNESSPHPVSSKPDDDEHDSRKNRDDDHHKDDHHDDD